MPNLLSTHQVRILLGNISHQRVKAIAEIFGWTVTETPSGRGRPAKWYREDEVRRVEKVNGKWRKTIPDRVYVKSLIGTYLIEKDGLLGWSEWRSDAKYFSLVSEAIAFIYADPSLKQQSDLGQILLSDA